MNNGRQVVRWLLAWGMGCSLAVWVKGAQPPTPTVLTNFQQVYGPLSDPAATGRPVRVEAVVVCEDKGWNQLYLHDGRETGYVPPQAVKTQLEVGQRVELTGTSVEEGDSRSVTNLEVRVLGRRALPQAKPLALAQLGNDRGQWIETTGRVLVTDTSWQRLALLLQDQGQECLVFVMGALKTNDFNGLLDCRVRVRGINASKATNGRLESATLMVPRAEEITVLEKPGGNPLSAPVSSIATLLSQELGPWTNNRVHINGLISSYEPGKYVEVRDPTGVLRAQIIQTTQAQPDARVDLWGFFRVVSNRTLLSGAHFEFAAAPGASTRLRAAAPVPSEAAKSRRELVRISEILKLRPEEAARGIPVRLEGVVTYAYPRWHNGFIQDKSGGVYFDLQQDDVRAGQWVELTGQTQVGGFANDVIKSTIRILGTTNLPAPVKADLGDLADGHLDAQWIELEGIVRRVTEEPEHVTLSLTTRRGHFLAIVTDFERRSNWINLVDALVNVKGACGSELNARGQLRGITLHVPSFDQIGIVDPAPPDPFSIGVIPIGSVAAFDPDLVAGRRVKVNGVITLKIPGHGFFLQDSSAGLWVHLQQTNDLQRGDQVDALGFPALGDFSPTLEETDVRRRGSGVPPIPKKVTAEQILLRGTNDGEVVQLDARLVQGVLRSANPQLMLEDGSIIFSARFVVPGQGARASQWSPGSLIRLTGVCVIDGGERHEPKSFRVLLDQSNDIRLLASPPWWSSRYTLALAAGLMFIVAAALVWVAALRRQVRAQTEVIRQKLEERNQFAESLAREKSLLATLIDHLPDNVFVKNQEGRYVMTNRAHTRFHGAPSSDLYLGKTSLEILPSDAARRCVEADEKILRDGAAIIEVEESMRDGQGNERLLSTTKVALRDGAGRLVGLVGISRDITERKKIENQLRQLSRAVEQSPASILITDLRGAIEYVNPAFTAGTGYTLDEIRGRDVRTLKSATEGHIPDQELWQIAASGGDWKGELRSLRKDGQAFWESTHISPIKDPDGTMTHLIAICEDITERKLAEAKLKQAQTELIHTSLLAGMAEVATSVLHNVGNVLNSLNVSTTLLTQSIRKSKAADIARVSGLLKEHASDLGGFITTDPKGKQLPGYLEQLGQHLIAEREDLLQETELIRQNVEHVKEIVAMQQNYARISGVSESVKASDLAEDALRLNARALERHAVRIVREYDPDLPEVTTEKHKVLQILVNLVSNAKYACDHSGKQDKLLTVRVAGGPGCVRFVLTDNGEGIPKENLARIFSHGFTTRKGGHGFGLHSGALAARELGGSLTVQSDGPGQGASFTLELPLGRASRLPSELELGSVA